jgi:hypothetical protein
MLTALKNINDYKWLIVLQFVIFVGIGYVFMTRKLMYFNKVDNSYTTIRIYLLNALEHKEKLYFENIRSKMNNDSKFYKYYSYDMFNALPKFKKECFIENYKNKLTEQINEYGKSAHQIREAHRKGLFTAINSLDGVCNEKQTTTII